MKSSKGRPYSSDLATRPRPVVCPYSPNTCLSSSSPAAPGLSILLPRIRMGQELSCSSVNKASSSTLLSTNLNNTSTFKFRPSDCMICVIFSSSPGPVTAVYKEHDGVHGGEVILPDPPGLVMAPKIESGKPGAKLTEADNKLKQKSFYLILSKESSSDVG